MSAAPIRYYDRYARTLKPEQIYGEGWLRFAYGNPLGRAMGAFAAWFVVMYQDLFVENHPYKQRIAQENFDWLRDASRTQKLVFGQRLLMANNKNL